MPKRLPSISPLVEAYRRAHPGHHPGDADLLADVLEFLRVNAPHLSGPLVSHIVSRIHPAPQFALPAAAARKRFPGRRTALPPTPEGPIEDPDAPVSDEEQAAALRDLEAIGGATPKRAIALVRARRRAAIDRAAGVRSGGVRALDWTGQRLRYSLRGRSISCWVAEDLGDRVLVVAVDGDEGVGIARKEDCRRQKLRSLPRAFVSEPRRPQRVYTLEIPEREARLASYGLYEATPIQRAGEPFAEWSLDIGGGRSIRVTCIGGEPGRRSPGPYTSIALVEPDPDGGEEIVTPLQARRPGVLLGSYAIRIDDEPALLDVEAR